MHHNIFSFLTALASPSKYYHIESYRIAYSLTREYTLSKKADHKRSAFSIT
ncbi:hypothetical protein P9D77_17615 [Bacillus rugosus]|uniref:hypothetical protein n=1 Tax=Bacillus rugosus TaxID=2715209 RepID=UPI002DBCEA51|nr:hypothetical protein [Bacillus rugosus]MEC1550108.1 hypothetical protein [Bacillus rugosus]